jgi:hypothetical protein
MITFNIETDNHGSVYDQVMNAWMCDLECGEVVQFEDWLNKRNIKHTSNNAGYVDNIFFESEKDILVFQLKTG